MRERRAVVLEKLVTQAVLTDPSVKQHPADRHNEPEQFVPVAGCALPAARHRRELMSEGEMESYWAVIRANIEYDTLVREHPCDEKQLDELVELMVEAVCSKRKTIRVSGNDFPQMVVKSRLLKLDREHIKKIEALKLQQTM